MSTTVGTTSDSSASNTTPTPSVNVNLTTARTIKKSDLSSKNLKTGDLEPILEGLHKLREHSYKASSRAQERIEIAIQSLLSASLCPRFYNFQVQECCL